MSYKPKRPCSFNGCGRLCENGEQYCTEHKQVANKLYNQYGRDPDTNKRYAMSVARWIQCEECISEYGFLAKHPTTGNAIQRPYVAMSQNFMAQTNRLWMEIFQIVKENCTGEYSSTNPQDDVMERLLSARKGK